MASPVLPLIRQPHEAAARIDVEVDRTLGVVYIDLTLADGHRWIALTPDHAIGLAVLLAEQSLKLDPSRATFSRALKRLSSAGAG